MSKSTQNNDNQEIDLSQISKKIGDFFEGISSRIFMMILFLKRNIIWIGILFILGIGLGIFMDRTSKVYDNEVIVAPNFNSNDYLYSKALFVSSKISDNDTVFLNKIGVKDPNKIIKLEIEPVVDVYKFIDNKATNFELIKLMAEDGDLGKIIKDNMTSKNYPFHLLKLTTVKEYSSEDAVEPILKYLNDSEYFAGIQKQFISNIKAKMTQNDSIITQINGVLGRIISSSESAKSNSLVYYNDNMQINDLIKTKEALVVEQGSHKVELLNSDKIIKEISVVNNIKNSSGANGKLKFILPVLFVGLFILMSLFIAFYKRESAKSKA